MSAIASIVGAVAAIFGTASSIYFASKQAKAAKRMEKLRKRQMELEAARRRRQLARQAVLSRAKIAAAASSAGIYQSSPVQGSLGSIAGITAGNIAYVNQSEDIGRQMFDARMDYISAQSGAATASALTGLAGGLFRNLAGISRVFG